MWEKMNLETYLGILMLMGILLLASGGMHREEHLEASADTEKLTIVIDAGHGGRDPGKVGVNGAIEKDINLGIAKKLKACLEDQSIRVVMIREEDLGLYDESSSNKKQQDMQRRCAIIDETDPVFTVSIHQNSYSSESVCGPQVFYYSQSVQGKAVAESIQDSLNQELDVERHRDVKANDTYYLLKKTKKPSVIVECGFLSNRQEEAKLLTEEYQQKVAQSICDGIHAYLSQGKSGNI